MNELISGLVAGEIEPSPIISQELLAHFCDNFSPHELRKLLASGIPQLEVDASWVLSELNPNIHKDINEIVLECLTNNRWEIRSHAVKHLYDYDAVDEHSAITVIQMLEDEDDYVRSLALDTVYNMRADLIRQVADREYDSDASVQKILKLLISACELADFVHTHRLLSSDSSLNIGLCAIMAAKICNVAARVRVDSHESGDAVVRDFLSDVLTENRIAESE